MDIAATARALQDRQTRFKRRGRPWAVMERLAAIHDRLIKLIDHADSRNCGLRERIQSSVAIFVNHDAIRHWPQIGALTAHDDGAKVLMRLRGVVGWLVMLAAVNARGLLGHFLRAARKTMPIPHSIWR